MVEENARVRGGLCEAGGEEAAAGAGPVNVMKSSGAPKRDRCRPKPAPASFHSDCTPFNSIRNNPAPTHLKRTYQWWFRGMITAGVLFARLDEEEDGWV